MNIFQKHKKTIKTLGFTLIELMVVISIIAFLSSVVLVALKSVRERANDTRVTQDMKQFEYAMQLYYNDHKTYDVVALNDINKNVFADNQTNKVLSLEWLDIFSVKKAEAAYSDSKCLKFATVAALLVQHKYLSSVPKHPSDDGSAVCYKAVGALDGSYFSAYGQLSTKYTWDTSKYKKTGVVLGEINTYNLGRIWSDTGFEYPNAVGGGPITNMSLASDIIIGAASSNTASASSSLYTINVVTTGSGSVSMSPNKTTYAPGESVTITSPAVGSIGVKWTGCTSYSGRNCYVTMGTLNKTINADFSQGYTITAYTSPAVPPNWSVSPLGDSNSYGYSSNVFSTYYYYPNQPVTIYMTAPDGYSLVGSNCSSFGGVLSIPSGSCTIPSMPSSDVSLYFYLSSPYSYTLTTIVEDYFEQFEGKTPGQIAGNSSPYGPGTTASLSAYPQEWEIFTGWTGCTNIQYDICYVTMDADKTVTASFGPMP